MRRRSFFKTLAAGILAGPSILAAKLPTPAAVAPRAVDAAVGKDLMIPYRDIRDILTENMLLDIQAEEDRLFLERVNSMHFA